jgi:uncharacterized protein YbjQ (UPF0145 family)
MRVSWMLVVTTDTVPGYEVHEVIGEVLGVTARSHNPFLEGIKSLNRGKVNPAMERILAGSRQEAVARMVEAARRRGANAVVGMRFDHRPVSPVWNEICAYGTAVHVLAADGSAPPDD